MKTPFTLLWAAVAVFACFGVRAALADDDSMEFLHQLDTAYPDVAIDYLQSLEKQGKLPKELRDVWDLEMSKSLRAASKQAYNAAEGEQLLKDSETHLKKFLAEKPNHPEATPAVVWLAGYSMSHAMDELRKSKIVTEKEKKAECLANAAQSLEEARPLFAQAAQKLAKQLAGMRRGTNKYLDVELNWLEARFQAALVDYYSGQTLADPADPKRSECLEKASKQFDAIFQANRGSLAGLFAHMWQGKCEDDKGNLELATDIYDEVLASMPDTTKEKVEPAMLGLFAQVTQFRFELEKKQCLAQKKSLNSVVKEQRLWLAEPLSKRLYKRTDGYQAIALDLAKTLLEQVDKSTGPDKQKFLAEAMALLAEMSTVPGPYQPEALQLRRKWQGGGAGGGGDPRGFDEAVVVADLAAGSKDWAAAAKAYRQAIDFAAKIPPKDRKRLTAARESAAGCLFMVARDQFNKAALEECLKTTGTIVHEYPETPAAPTAASLACTVALNLYAGAKDETARTAALGRVTKLCRFTIDKWPGKPEADDARIGLGQVFLTQHKIPEALAEFDDVTPKSERYGRAMFLAAQACWRLYMVEKLKEEGQRKADVMAANRDRAAKDIAAGVEALRKAAPPNKPMPRELLEAQLLQAEIALDAGDGKGAAVLFQPLVDAVKAEGLKTLDNVTIRIFLGGIRAYIAINDLEKAGKVSGLLVESGPDTPAVNSVLLNFAKILSQQRRETAKAAEIEVDPTKHQALLDQVASMDDLLQKLLGNLGKRKELSTHADLAAKGALWIADALTQVGQEDAAAEQIKICQQRAKEDPQWNAIVSKGVTYLRTKLVQAQAQKGKYPEAIKQIDALIAEHDRALEPKMTKGRILQEWAQKDPSHFKEALMHWEDLREKLERMKVKPGEFFDVTYYEAVCVENEALNLKKKGDREGAAKEALKAEKLLQSTLVRNSKLETTEETKKKEGQGVERRKQYKVLMDRLEILQGRQPVPEKKSR